MVYTKTSPPSLPGMIERTRLFSFLDQNRDRQAIWIQGQAGAGKTTLVASFIKQCGVKSLWYRMDGGDDDPASFFHYFTLAAEELLSLQQRSLPKLTPELLSNLVPFSRLFFRELFERLPKPLLLVFDDVHTLRPDSPLNEIIAVALSEIPREINAVMISRCQPLASLCRMQLNRAMVILDQKDLRFTDEEVLSLSQLWFQNKISVEMIQRMNELVDGWVAGLVLLFEHGGYEDSASEVGKDYFFSYFANEVFNSLEASKRDFLLKTACLKGITSSVARELTGNTEAQNILEDLCERHYFTSRSDHAEPVYQYHPLFQDFLISRGRDDFGNEGWQRIIARAAHVLAGFGQIEEAIVLANAAADWSLLGQLINQQAPTMLTQQRFQLLEQWLKQLPHEELNSSPWLHYWFGCCLLPFDQRKSGNHFQLAYTGFVSQQEQNGMLLSSSGVILSIMTEWDDFRSLDPWIAWLDELVDKIPDYPSTSTEAMVVLAMLGALLFRMPQHPKMGHWEAHAERLIRENAIDISIRMDIGNVLVHWQYWKGDLAAATLTTDTLAQFIDAGGSATLPRLLSAMNHAIHDWHTAEFDHCLDCIESGLILAAEMGIHIVDDRLMSQNVYASLSRDDLVTAGVFLHQMKKALKDSRRLAMSGYHYLKCNYHFIAGNLEMARQHGRIAVDINQEVGTPFPEALASCTLAQICFEMGDQESATSLLAKVNSLAKDMQSRTLELLYEMTSAWFKLQHGHEEAVLSHLRRGLTLQRKMGFLNFPGWRTGMMKPLLLKALGNDIESDFVKCMIRKRDLHINTLTLESESWPWPVKIYTLGRFSLLINDQPLLSKGKSQQKPLELLKTLITLGGRGVSKDRLIDILWPDTDGDKGLRSLDTTLHRFRKLVGYEDVIQVQDRKLTLNSQLCWIDTWVLENLLLQTEVRLDKAKQDCEQVVKLKQQLFALYKGGFLSGEEEPDCIFGYREKLRDRYLNRLALLGSYWESRGDWMQAITLYQRILEMDDRQELIHQRLITCYQNKGLVAESIAAYERCRESLFTHYGIPPSAETEALYLGLR